VGLFVVRPGLFATVQDLGRPGSRAWGVPPGGSFDAASADLANALLGNPADAAVVELTLIGGAFEARAPLALALAGAPLAATLAPSAGPRNPLIIPSAFALDRGDRLELGGAPRGARAYLAVLGGWQTPPVLGSRSSEVALRAGDVLPARPGWTPRRRPDPALDPFEPADARPLRLVGGPDALGFDLSGLFGPDAAYRVGPESDRMGLRLVPEGASWDWPADPDRPSAAVAPGALQAAPGGPLVLGAACGTMGGYPHVAHVVAADLGRLGQARPGDRLRFQRISLAEARRLDGEARRRTARRRRRLTATASDGAPGGGGARPVG